MTTDQLLITGLQQENRAVIDKIYQQYHRRIYLFAKSYLKMGDDSADIVQEVFVKLWMTRHELKDDTNLDAFIFTIARNAVISVFRKRSSEKKYMALLEQMAVTEGENETQAHLDYKFLNDQLNEIVDGLPLKRKEVFVLSRQKGLSNKEIAGQLSISEKTVEDHITKALSFIRHKMEAAGVVAMLFYFMHCC